nr:cobalamin biosynthesis protein [uncultured Shimia sp.]
MIVAGFGFRGAATSESLRDALLQASRGQKVDALSAPEDKVEDTCLKTLATTLGLTIHAVSSDAMTAISTPTQSNRVLEKRGTGSVAEACALAASGPHATLIAQRHVSSDRMATCALAQSLKGDPQ